jgi:GNAT superfamily N-acetyltransferase
MIANGVNAHERLTHRLATLNDLPRLRALTDAAIRELQKPFLDVAQIDSSRMIMGLDSQLVDYQTYFIVEMDGRAVGCGGWSRRATLYGWDQTPGRDAGLLNPRLDAAKVRAMYTHPAYARRGIGRMVLGLREEAARQAGFASVDVMATLSGEPLYLACGYEDVERVSDGRGGTDVPLVRMCKDL